MVNYHSAQLVLIGCSEVFALQHRKQVLKERSVVYDAGDGSEGIAMMDLKHYLLEIEYVWQRLRINIDILQCAR